MALSNLTKVQTVGIGSNIEVVGVVTTGQFKSGTSNLHSTGVELTNLNVSGIATIGGNLSIGGTLTYEDVTNIDSIGIVTARSGIHIDDSIVHIGDTNTKIRFPAGDEIQFETGGSTRLHIGSGNITQTIDSDGEGLIITAGNMKPMLTGNSNRSAHNNTIFGISGKWNNTEVGRIAFEAGADTTNKDDGKINLYTRPSGGSLTSRLLIDSNGYVGIGTNNPQRPLTLTSGTSGITAEFNIPDNSPTGSAGLSFNITDRSQSSTYAPLSFNATLYTFGNSGTERVRIDNNGILLLGHTSSPTSDADKLQVISTASGTGICLHNYSASNYGNQIAFMKSRSNTIGTNTVLNQYDRIGELNFYGNDGSGRSLGAQIQVRTDGTTTNNNTPAYLAFNTGLNQSMQTRLRISSSGVSCFSKTHASTGVVEPGNFILNVHTGAELNDGIKIVTNHNSGNQNSDSGKLMFCGEGQSNGVYIYKDNAISYGKGDMVFHTRSTANDYTTQLAETARFTAYGRFGLGTGGPGQTTVDSLMHIVGNSDNGDEHCQLTIEDSDDTAGSKVPSIMFKGNGSQLCKIRATDSNIIRIYDNNDAERWLINEYGETISEESEHGWSTYEYHAKSGGTRFHYRRVATGASGTQINLIRVRRHYWGSGNYKIKVRQTYYNGSYESHFWLNGHAANGNTTSFSIAHSGQNGGNSAWIQKTATSHSSPGNNYAGWTDVYANLGAYEYYEIIIEASTMASYSHDINNIGNDGYALHAF